MKSTTRGVFLSRRHGALQGLIFAIARFLRVSQAAPVHPIIFKVDETLYCGSLRLVVLVRLMRVCPSHHYCNKVRFEACRMRLSPPLLSACRLCRGPPFEHKPSSCRLHTCSSRLTKA